VALFRSENVPPVPSFQVLQGIYLSMHPGIVERLPASEGILFRRDIEGMWEELVDRGRRAPYARGLQPGTRRLSLARYN
jgi:hypothetical protein